MGTQLDLSTGELVREIELLTDDALALAEEWGAPARAAELAATRGATAGPVSVVVLGASELSGGIPPAVELLFVPLDEGGPGADSRSARDAVLSADCVLLPIASGASITTRQRELAIFAAGRGLNAVCAVDVGERPDLAARLVQRTGAELDHDLPSFGPTIPVAALDDSLAELAQVLDKYPATRWALKRAGIMLEAVQETLMSLAVPESKIAETAGDTVAVTTAIGEIEDQRGPGRERAGEMLTAAIRREARTASEDLDGVLDDIAADTQRVIQSATGERGPKTLESIPSRLSRSIDRAWLARMDEFAAAARRLGRETLGALNALNPRPPITRVPSTSGIAPGSEPIAKGPRPDPGQLIAKHGPSVRLPATINPESPRTKEASKLALMRAAQQELQQWDQADIQEANRWLATYLKKARRAMSRAIDEQAQLLADALEARVAERACALEEQEAQAIEGLGRLQREEAGDDRLVLARQRDAQATALLDRLSELWGRLDAERDARRSAAKAEDEVRARQVAQNRAALRESPAWSVVDPRVRAWSEQRAPGREPILLAAGVAWNGPRRRALIYLTASRVVIVRWSRLVGVTSVALRLSDTNVATLPGSLGVRLYGDGELVGRVVTRWPSQSALSTFVDAVRAAGMTGVGLPRA